MKKIKLVGLLLGIISVFSFSLNVFAGSESSVNEVAREDKKGFSGKLKCSFKDSEEMKKKVKGDTEKLMVVYSKIKEAVDYTINEIKKDKRWDFKVIENRKEDILGYILSSLANDSVFNDNEGFIYLSFGESFYRFFKKVLSNLDKVEITEEVFEKNKKGIINMMEKEVKRYKEYVKIQKTDEGKKSYEEGLKFWEDYIKKVLKVKYKTFKLVEKNYIRPKDLEGKEMKIKLDRDSEKKEVFGKLRCSFRDVEEMEKLKDNTEKLMVIYSKIKQAMGYTLKKEPNKISKKDYDLILYYILHQFCLVDNKDDKHITYGLHHNNNGCLFLNLSEDGYKFFKKVLSNLDKVKITEYMFKQNKKEVVRVINKKIEKGRDYMKKVKGEKRKKECEKEMEQLKENIKKVENVKYETFKMVEKNYIYPKDLEEKTNIKKEKYKGGVDYD